MIKSAFNIQKLSSFEEKKNLFGKKNIKSNFKGKKTTTK